jgi:ribosomal protein S18 acetylase RimI-like enzyme
MKQSLFNVRVADIADAKNLALLAESTFRRAFEKENTASDMAKHCRKSYSEKIQSEEIANPNIITLVIEDEDEMVGYSQLHWGDSPECIKSNEVGEIRRIYVSHWWHGKGVGLQLMEASIEQLNEKSTRGVWLGVWEKNPRAIAFYKKLGFIVMGEHKFMLGDDLQRDIIMFLANN